MKTLIKFCREIYRIASGLGDKVEIKLCSNYPDCGDECKKRHEKDCVDDCVRDHRK